MSTAAQGTSAPIQPVPSPVQSRRVTPWSVTLVLVQLGFVALWVGAAAVAPTTLTTSCVMVAGLMLAWTCWLVLRRKADRPDTPSRLSRESSTTIVTSVWLAASVVGVGASLLRSESAALVAAVLGGVLAVGMSRLRPPSGPARRGGLRLLQASVLLYLGVGVILFVLLEPELTPGFEGANIGGAILGTFVGGPLLTAGVTTMVLGLVAELARPSSWSWLFLAAAGAAVVQIASKVMVSFQVGCPPPSRADTGPPADFSFIPPGINCTYDLGPRAGHLTTEPSLFPILFIAACVLAYLLLRRAERRTQTGQPPAYVSQSPRSEQ